MNEEALILNILSGISDLNTKEECFGWMCKLSFHMETLTSDGRAYLSRNNEIYVDIVYNIFNSEIFINNLKIAYFSTDKLKGGDAFEILQILLRAMYFPTAILIKKIDESTAYFFKKHFFNSIRSLISELENAGVSVVLKDILILIDKINFDPIYRFSVETYRPINLQFLNRNQMLSRMLLSTLALDLIAYKCIPLVLKDKMDNKKHPGAFFGLCAFVEKKRVEYEKYNNTLSTKYFDSSKFQKTLALFEKLKNKNISDLLFIVNSLPIDLREEHRDQSIERMCISARDIHLDLFNNFKKLSFFSNNGGHDDGNWSNKLFIQTFNFLHTLECISDASNKGWRAKVFNHFFYDWLNQIHEIVNKNRLNDYDTFNVFVEGESDKILLTNAYNKLYPRHQGLVFYDAGGSHEIYKKLSAVNVSEYNSTTFGIFDFDSAFNDFKGLKKFGDISGDIHYGLLRSRNDGMTPIHAILLPVPESRSTIANLDLKERSCLSIELLFEDSFLNSLGYLSQLSVPGGGVISSFTEKGKTSKIDFATSSSGFSASDFSSFQPIFERIFGLLE